MNVTIVVSIVAIIIAVTIGLMLERLEKQALGKPYIREIIKSPASDIVVSIEDHGEHHMGASHIYLRLNRRVGGRKVFRSTNGRAVFSARGQFLILHDALLVIFFDRDRNKVHHLSSKHGLYYKNALFEEARIIITQRDGFGKDIESIVIPLSGISIIMKPGLGPARWGNMPSVYP